jgi:2-hydroxycyclohexanecarboxyl-CoA dehydrogenase
MSIRPEAPGDAIPPDARVVLVTGAASGIGGVTARVLSDAGWAVAGVDLRDSECEFSLVVDVTDRRAVQEAVTNLEREVGPIDALVSAAGYYEMVPIGEITAVQWHAMLDLHLGGLVNLSRAVLPGMVQRRAGHVVAIASELAIGGGDGDAHYAAAKGAILGFVRSLALDVAEFGVRVNCVAPGPTDTPLLATDSPWRAPEYLATLPCGRLVRPEEIARVIRYLVTEGSQVVGEVISVNSGAVI